MIGAPNLQELPAITCESCGLALPPDAPWCLRCNESAGDDVDPAAYREIHRRLIQAVAAAFIVAPWAFYELRQASRLLREFERPDQRTRKVIVAVFILAGLMTLPWIVDFAIRFLG